MKCSKCQFDNPDATNFCGKCGEPLAADARMADSLTKTLATPLPIITKDKLIAGKYRIIEEIGQGGMGIVYKAEDLKLKRCVALKFLPPHLMDSPELKERFLIEAQAAAALSHPNICVIHEVGESGEHPYIAMEYVEGETLRDKIRKGPLKSEEALAIVGQVAAGLAEAHRKGIIHRDIKSANIMVTDKGQAKVMDFGLAKLRGGSSLTKSQTTLGTVAYMSPEQARGGDLDQRTDIWSLGVVLYEMLAGKLPFRGDHDQAVIHSILHDEPESLKKARPDAAPGLEQIVGQALAKKPADRYRTMEEFGRPRGRGRRSQAAQSQAEAGRAEDLGDQDGLCLCHPDDRPGPSPRPQCRRIKEPASRPGRPGSGHQAGRSSVREPVGRPATGVLQRRDDPGDDRAARPTPPGTLSVIARSSVLRYKKTNTPIDQVGRELTWATCWRGASSGREPGSGSRPS